MLSEKGWIRAAKGHDIDPAALSYKSGDGFRFAARGKSNLPTWCSTRPAEPTPYPRISYPPPAVRENPSPGASTRHPAPPLRAVNRGGRRPLLVASDAGYGLWCSSASCRRKTRPARRCSPCPRARRCYHRRHCRRREPLVVVATNEGACWCSRWRTPGDGAGQGQQVDRHSLCASLGPRGVCGRTLRVTEGDTLRSRRVGTTVTSSGRSLSTSAESGAPGQVTEGLPAGDASGSGGGLTHSLTDC